MISAGGPPGQLVDAWLDQRFELVTSAFQMNELVRAMQYPKLASRLQRDRVGALMRNMQVATVVVPVEGIGASPDPDDNMILGTAVAGQVDLIVSGDRDLVKFKEVGGIQIVTAREAIKRIEA